MKARKAVLVLLVAAVIISCGTKPPLRKGEVLIEDKGTAYGIKTPKWVELAIIGGYRDIEKLPDYKDKVVFIAQFEAQNLQSAQLLAERMQADTEIARYLSTRVKDAFKGANVADADSKNFGAYGERFVMSVGEATFSGFRMEADWWVKVQTYTPENKPDKQIYRVIQLWAIDKNMLQKQFDMLFSQMAGGEPPTPEQKRAMDLVQNTVTKDFFGESD
ncbi:MAG TPA: hypothetical protein PK105_07065 [Rectinema sp.]|jgi:hypothetical protein|nr:MAG: hypothetical protein BWX44_00255 [Spirochaetes bacterium ADurb.Bin001]HNP92249.1 hypothetical protein [Rectinema sp.]HNZ92672.1 hypothetical protein [Rectinema sp.]HOC26491.1 hypothetical protein [Rectinema sp.]HOH16124.1 hypothetical protein [Rectinema sp.]